MARIGFLSHSDMSIFYFRSPIMRALKELGHEVFAIEPKGAYTDLISNEFKTIIYEIDKASLNPFKTFYDTQKLANILKPLNLDLLQTAAHKSNVFGTFAAKKAKIKKVLNLVEGLGSFYIDNDFKTRIIRSTMEILYKKAFRESDGVIFVNDSDPDYMLSKGLLKKEQIYRIKSVGVDAGVFDPIKTTPFDYKSDKKIVLMIGRALWHKGIGEFYKAAEILKNRKDCEFVFVGDGFEGNRSSADESFLTSPYVRHIKWSDEIKELLRGAYVYVLPSYKEGFPRTVLEAMSMQIPCVVSDASGCIEAVVNGENGLICEVRNPRDLAKKIEVLLDNPNLAQQMGKIGRKMVLQNYNQPIITEKYLNIYRKFIDI